MHASFGLALAAVCGLSVQAAEPPRPIRPTLSAITGEGLMRHIRVLSSDEFEGRAPGSPGETKTVAYLVEQFKAMGLQPGNPDGTYVQQVPLAGFTSRPAASYLVNGQKTELTVPDNAVVWSPQLVPTINVDNSEMVFVGYGVVAPSTVGTTTKELMCEVRRS